MRSKNIQDAIVAMGYTAQQASWIAGEAEPTELDDLLWLYQIVASGTDTERAARVAGLITERCSTFDDWKRVERAGTNANLSLLMEASKMLAALAVTTEQILEHGTDGARSCALRELAEKATTFESLVALCTQPYRLDEQSLAVVCKKLGAVPTSFDGLLNAVKSYELHRDVKRVLLSRLMPLVSRETVGQWPDLWAIIESIESDWTESIQQLQSLSERMSEPTADRAELRLNRFSFWLNDVCGKNVHRDVFREGFIQLLGLAESLDEAARVCHALHFTSSANVTFEMWLDAEQLVKRVPANRSEILDLLRDCTGDVNSKDRVTAKRACVGRLAYLDLTYAEWVELDRATDGRTGQNSIEMEVAIATGRYATAETANQIVETLEATGAADPLIEACLRVCRKAEDWETVYKAVAQWEHTRNRVLMAMVGWAKSTTPA